MSSHGRSSRVSSPGRSGLRAGGLAPRAAVVPRRSSLRGLVDDGHALVTRGRHERLTVVGRAVDRRDADPRRRCSRRPRPSASLTAMIGDAGTGRAALPDPVAREPARRRVRDRGRRAPAPAPALARVRLGRRGASWRCCRPRCCSSGWSSRSPRRPASRSRPALPSHPPSRPHPRAKGRRQKPGRAAGPGRARSAAPTPRRASSRPAANSFRPMREHAESPRPHRPGAGAAFRPAREVVAEPLPPRGRFLTTGRSRGAGSGGLAADLRARLAVVDHDVGGEVVGAAQQRGADAVGVHGHAGLLEAW